MAIVNIAEFSGFLSRLGAGGWHPAVAAPPVTVQQVAIGGASVQSAAMNATTTIVRINTDATAWVAFGANPTAAVGNSSTVRIPANATEFFGVQPGSKIAVITGS